MCCDNNEKDFILTIMLALGVCLCVIAFFCGGEMMMKVPAWTRCVICIAAGLISLAVCAIVLCFCVSSVCKVFNCCKAIKISEKEYFVLTKENINNRCTLENQRNILVYDDVTCIPKKHFIGFHNLEKIEFYGKVRIQEAAFFGCTNLNEVVFHNDITSIGENAFTGCKELKEITLSSGVTEIKDNTFNNFEYLERIIISDDDVHVSKNAFVNCKKLNGIILTDSVTNIKDSMFSGADFLKILTIPKSVTSIGDNAFAGCTKLLTINYAGTKNDWNTTITDFGSNWKQSVPATGVTCNDGKKYKLENDGKLSEVIAESCN